MAPYAAITLDVTDHVPGLSGPLLMSAWLFSPCDRMQGIVFCLPESSKAYYHLVVPGHPQEMFSLALYMAERGWLVIAIDPLGSGESTCPIQGVTTEMHSSAFSFAQQQAVARLIDGSLVIGFSPIASPERTICIGHGRGAMLALAQQSHYHSYDALAILGWSNYRSSLGIVEALLADVMREADMGVDKRSSEISRIVSLILRSWLFLEGTPFSLIEAYEAQTTDVLRLLTTYDYNLIQKNAALIDVPIFLCLAEYDIATNLHAEAATYPWTPEMTLFHLMGSAHCHNFALTREYLWAQIETWAHRMQKHHIGRKTAIDGE